MPIVLITGAAGQIGTMLRPRLARPGRTLRLLDTAPLTPGPDEQAIRASVTSLDAMTEACRDAEAVIHLAGIPGEAPWSEIREVNIEARLSAPSPGFRVIFGVSANTRGGCGIARRGAGARLPAP